MNRRRATFAILGLPLPALASERGQPGIRSTELALRAPTIVILLDSPSEQRQARKSDQNYDEASGDFGVYTDRMLQALMDYKQITIRWSHAKRVTFPGTSFSPVIRSQVGGGWGYVFFRPGSAPIVVQGVATDDELVCRASALFTLRVEGYKCEASQVSRAK
jgi:hypothetical protein